MDDTLASCPNHPGQICVRMFDDKVTLFHNWVVPGSTLYIIEAGTYYLEDFNHRLTRSQN